MEIGDTGRRITPQGEAAGPYLNPVRIFALWWHRRDLIRQLTRREVLGRYQGSILGLGWSFVQPLAMLCAYTFVFSVIFKVKWGLAPDEGRGGFALALFMGMLTFAIFAEMANGAPRLVLENANYVKRSVFPLEVLPVVRLLGILVNTAFGLAVWLGGLLALQQKVTWTLALLPLTWLPVILFALGCGYFLASLGVFIRDIGATVNVVTTILFFLTPIFYPLEMVPEPYRIFVRLNPLALFVEDARRVALKGLPPDWLWLGGETALGLLVLILGFIWFMKTKKAFADVI